MIRSPSYPDKAASSSAASYYLDNFRVSTPFSPNKGINDGWHSDGHKGIDLAGKSKGAADGKNIPALVGGKVITVFKGNKTAGNGVVIQGTDGREYRYIHMKYAPKLKVGQTVNAGANLGQIGSTGRSSGPHLDLKIKENGKYIDPLKVLKSISSGAGSGGKSGGGTAQTNFPSSSGKQTANKSSYTNTWKLKKEAKQSKSYQEFKGHLKTAYNMGMGIKDSDIVPLAELIGRESTWTHNADNPTSTAWGYGQFLKGTRADYKKKYPKLDYGNPVHQVVLTYKYAIDRYGSVEAALKFWDKNKWY